MGSPVAMAAFTTMLAGALMMPSTVLAYRRFGTFLLLLVSLAWLYATFFFQSLLRTIGPHGGFGQFHWPASDCCTPSSREHVDKTVYALSESTLSTSSTSTREHSHYSYSRELEPLTDNENCPPHQHHRHHHHHHHHHNHSNQCKCDSNSNRHHQRVHSHQNRPRRKSDYTSVRTNVSSTETSPLKNQDHDSPLPSACSSTQKPTSTSAENNTLNVPSDLFTSGPSNNDLSSENSNCDFKMVGSDSDNVMSECEHHGTTQAQIEIFPRGLPLEVA